MEAIYTTVIATVLFANPVQDRQRVDQLLRQVAERTATTKQKAEALHERFVTEDLGVAGSDNFTVLADRTNDFLARGVLARAEELRREIAIALLGEELPKGAQFTHINVELDDTKDEGLTLLAGPGRPIGGNNRIWLTTTRECALGSTLAHEITHVVLAARFPSGMPAWANEGIASLADDSERSDRRNHILREMATRNRWPALDEILSDQTIPPTDEFAYAVSTSLTEFLLTRSDAKQLLRFVEDGRQHGWDTAIRRHYEMDGIPQFEMQWRNWIEESITERRQVSTVIQE